MGKNEALHCFCRYSPLKIKRRKKRLYLINHTLENNERRIIYLKKRNHAGN